MKLIISNFKKDSRNWRPAAVEQKLNKHKVLAFSAAFYLNYPKYLINPDYLIYSLIDLPGLQRQQKIQMPQRLQLGVGFNCHKLITGITKVTKDTNNTMITILS